MGRLIVAAIVSLWIISISILVNRIVPEPYMDEIFHVPQAQKYCNGDFNSWDPMITTPPGLYYLSLAHVASFFPGIYFAGAAAAFSDACSASVLRSINGVLAVICSVIIYETITHLRPSCDRKKATVFAVVLALYPLHWFFSFLYYTDVASLTAVLAMYLACLKRNYHSSALLGALAVLIRQTNIIWMVFVACTGVLEILTNQQNEINEDDNGVPIEKRAPTLSSKRGPKASNLRKRNVYNAVETAPSYISSLDNHSMTKSRGLLDEIQTLLSIAWKLKWGLLVSFSPFLVVLVAFVAFIRWNGGIVLGAKDAHTVSPHFPQILYLGLISALATAPLHFTLSQLATLSRSFLKNKCISCIQMAVAWISAFLAVHLFSIAHPYLLADNRHYPFYLWRKVIGAHWSMKYLLVPLYIYSWTSIITTLGKVQNRIWVLAYVLASAAALVPAPLIEFRYFTIPFYLMGLHCQIDDYRSLLLMGSIYVAVNIFTMKLWVTAGTSTGTPCNPTCYNMDFTRG